MIGFSVTVRLPLSFQTFFQLGKLTNLKHLRLEHGGEIPDVGLGDALLNLKQ